MIDIAALKRVRLWAEHGLKSDLSDLVAAVSHIDALEAEVARLLEALEAVTDDLEAEIEAKRGTVLARTTERDLASVRDARAAIAAAKGA